MVHMPDNELQEQLHLINDEETGVTGVIAIHSTALGPAAGGCRVWNYDDREAMLTDALRLARGMSYKNAMAGLPFGGGKAVLQRPDPSVRRSDLFRVFGDAVAALGGSYITAEDVGTSVADMQIVRSRTSYVAGLELAGRQAGGDPSPWTALGVFESMKAAASWLDLDLSRVTVAVQGVGNVGEGLCRLLAKHGAKLVVADIDEARAARVAKAFGAQQVGVDEILSVDAQVLAPCALGGVLNDTTLPRLKAQLVCGGANNQLSEERHGTELQQMGIVYAPDYVVNAGGIINVSAEYLGETTAMVERRVMQIGPRLIGILDQARDSELAVNVVADRMAQRLISVRACQAA